MDDDVSTPDHRGALVTARLGEYGRPAAADRELHPLPVQVVDPFPPAALRRGR